MLENEPELGKIYRYPHKDGYGKVQVVVVKILMHRFETLGPLEKSVQIETVNGPWGGFARIELFKELAEEEPAKPKKEWFDDIEE